MPKKRIRLGLMGGTFDPIHYGHLVTAEEARVCYDLTEVIFIPSGHPPHKTNLQVSDAQHRLTMCLLATVTNQHFWVSDIEVKRPGFSYTYDTVRAIKQAYDNQAEVFFITGADAVKEILDWKDFDKLIEECTFIAATRPGYILDLDKQNTSLPPHTLEKILPLEVTALAISSTDVRQKVMKNCPIKYLLPETVENYIYKYNLYKNAGGI